MHLSQPDVDLSVSVCELDSSSRTQLSALNLQSARSNSDCKLRMSLPELQVKLVSLSLFLFHRNF